MSRARTLNRWLDGMILAGFEGQVRLDIHLNVMRVDIAVVPKSKDRLNLAEP